MLGISQISKEVNKKSKVGNEETTKKVLNAFLETIQQKLNQGESINFKGYFTIKRSIPKTKGSKNCSKHEKSLNDFKQANPGQGVAFYAKSEKFRGLVRDTRNCKDCQGKKQQLIKSAKPTNRVNFKVSKGFWKVGKMKGNKKIT
jgi:nucleoid DNA-binding protein